MDDDAMAQIGEWLQEMVEDAGKQGQVVGAFAAAFPPLPRWGDPWLVDLPVGAELPPFAPDAASYAAALREIAQGRRRVRLAGRWETGQPGTLVATAGGASSRERASWSVVEAIGLDADE